MGLRCLIVDDHAPFLDAARVLLEQQGLEVVGLASGGAQALEQAEELRPDVVLVDVMLGDESGFDVARRLRDAGSTVVLISTHAETDIEELVADSAAAGFLPKSKLSAAAIREIVGGERAAR